MLLSVAWKNVWRNKLRSLVVIFAVMIGMLAGSIGVAIMEGMAKKRAKTAINNEISHVQIHHPEFQENYESKFYIHNAESIMSELKKDPKVIAVASRTILSGMLNTSGGNTGGFIYGIDPDAEKKLTEVYKYIKDSSGTYFDGQKEFPVLISETTAKKLKLDRYKLTKTAINNLVTSGFPKDDTVALYTLIDEEFRTQKDFFNGLRETINPILVEEFEFLFIKYAILFKERSKVVLTFQDTSAHLTGNIFRVTGIYKTSNRMFDEMTIFVKKNDLASLTGYKESNPHEIAILLQDRGLAKGFAKEIREKYPDLKIDSWGEIDPMLIMLAEYMEIYNYFMIALVLAALAFGIVNTMLMAVLERTKELGMLAAIGMNRKRIFNMIMIETIFLTIVGAIVGLAINYGIISYYSVKGFDLTKNMGEAFEAIGFDSMVYPEMGPKYYIGITVLVIVAAILSSIYPALKAIKLNPADAVRTDA